MNAGVPVCPSCRFDTSAYRAPAAALPPFTVLHGRYRIGRVVGHGGFGMIYLAQDTENNRRCAIKEYFRSKDVQREPGSNNVVPIDSDRERVIRQELGRFLKEAESLKKFRSDPTVVDIWDCFRENNTAYIVMEYLDGLTLRQLMKRSPDGKGLPLDFALDAFMVVANTLKEMHKKNVLHRDLKPENIFYTRSKQIKLIDFGTARDYVLAREQQTGMSVIYTQGYAPPEQMLRTGRQGAWTDVFGLCATFYCLVSGKKPDPKEVGSAPGRPGQLPDLYQLGCGVPREISDIIHKGMEQDYRERYQSFDELLDDLASCLSVKDDRQRREKEQARQRREEEQREREELERREQEQLRRAWEEQQEHERQERQRLEQEQRQRLEQEQREREELDRQRRQQEQRDQKRREQEEVQRRRREEKHAEQERRRREQQERAAQRRKDQAADRPGRRVAAAPAAQNHVLQPLPEARSDERRGIVRKGPPAAAGSPAHVERRVSPENPRRQIRLVSDGSRPGQGAAISQDSQRRQSDRQSSSRRRENGWPPVRPPAADPEPGPEEMVHLSGPVAEISVVSGELTGVRRQLRPGQSMMVGRDASVCRISFLSDTNVSRSHCRLALSDDGKSVFVTDLSSNGTFLAGGERLPKGREYPVPGGTVLYLATKKNALKIEITQEFVSGYPEAGGMH